MPVPRRSAFRNNFPDSHTIAVLSASLEVAVQVVTGEVSQVSELAVFSVIGISLPLGGHSEAGEAVTLALGALVSTTVMLAEQLAPLPAASLPLQTTEVPPSE